MLASGPSLQAGSQNTPRSGVRLGRATWSFPRNLERQPSHHRLRMMSLIHSEQLVVYDVFLFDSDFRIERPTRYYRQGFHLLRVNSNDSEKKVDKGKGKEADRSLPSHQGEGGTGKDQPLPPTDIDCMSTLGSFRSKISHAFKRKKVSEPEAPPRPSVAGSGGPPRVSTDDTVSTISLHSERAPTPILDPSTHTNPLLSPQEDRDLPHPSRKGSQDDVSKHTFYIENSQMRLKINAKNERQMLQWISALEKSAATCHFTRRSRFDSFAPIRLNVAAQWLVDGVSRCLDPCPFPKLYNLRLARLFLEPFPCYSARKGVYLYPRLVVISR